jgi:organic radical activating enzyme
LPLEIGNIYRRYEEVVMKRELGKAKSERTDGNVVEIFSGIQGEGIHVGRRQIFLRLAGCNLACDYCDQPEARIAPAQALIELAAGQRDFISVRNPLGVEPCARAILRLDRPRGLHHSVSLTGGEPLMQQKFLAALLPILRRAGLRIFLETNGTRPAEFRALRHLVDIVSMDFKLRSATGRQKMPAKAHAEFLRLAASGGREVYVKAVVSSRTTGREIARAARLIAKVKRAVPLVIQPVTRLGEKTPAPPDPARLLELQAAAAKILPDVRVIPQTHKIIGQR